MKIGSISILGCGWLGMPLAESLVQKGFKVKGSTTNSDKIPTLSAKGIIPFLINLNKDSDQKLMLDFLSSSTLILNVPPSKVVSLDSSFQNSMSKLLDVICVSGVKNVLFISSTSVFEGMQGDIDESVKPIPGNIRSQRLVDVENLFLAEKRINTTILRFGGLIGEDRHPVNFLAGRKGLSGGGSPVNLIHLDDCIGIINGILDMEFYTGIFHGVAPFHPLKKDYYTNKAIQLGLDLPTFKVEKTPVNRLIKSSNLKSLLNYKFIRPEL